MRTNRAAVALLDQSHIRPRDTACDARWRRPTTLSTQSSWLEVVPGIRLTDLLKNGRNEGNSCQINAVGQATPSLMTIPSRQRAPRERVIAPIHRFASLLAPPLATTIKNGLMFAPR